MAVHRFKLEPDFDEQGQPIVCTWDLLPLADPQSTRHLDERGLPRPGTQIEPGMVVIGRIGKSQQFDPGQQPSALELHGLDFAELHNRYARLWRDYSVYATERTVGTVESARLVQTPDGPEVLIEVSDEPRDEPALTGAGAESSDIDK